MKWEVNCAEALCGAEIYEAASKEQALGIAEKKYSHDRVPHKSWVGRYIIKPYIEKSPTKEPTGEK